MGFDELNKFVMAYCLLLFCRLEGAKLETERVQKRVDVAEEEKNAIIKQAEKDHLEASKILEIEKLKRDEALMNERKARMELQKAFETEKVCLGSLFDKFLC